MRPFFKDILVISSAFVIALKLFLYGLSMPVNLRVLGDAAGYLRIAIDLRTFSDILNFSGERTIGFPFLEFIVRQAYDLLAVDDYMLGWVNAVCITLFILHLIAAWCFSRWARVTHLIKTNAAAYIIFMLLATCPVLIGHTTTPITDTFAIDLILFSLMFTEKAIRTTHLYKSASYSIISSALFAMTILVRPSYMPGILLALVVTLAVSLFCKLRMVAIIAAIAVGCMVAVIPYYFNCSQRYGELCLQSPATFNPVLSAQEGLKGARMLWAKLPLMQPGHFPIVKDEFMVNNFYTRCHLSTIVGLSEASLTGCLMSRPVATVAFVTKKWVGLFDHFRFTPYLELATPIGLVWLSRAYGSIAWIGLGLILLRSIQLVREKNVAEIRSVLATNATLLMLICFSVAMLAQHTALHVEERYGFTLLPICYLMFIIFCEEKALTIRLSGWRSFLPFLLLCIALILLFILQITAWDNLANV